MKVWRISKTVLYLTAALLILIFHEEIQPWVGYLVGGVIFAYALEELILAAVEKKLSVGHWFLAECPVQIIVGALMMLSSHDIVRVCVIWGVWSILREARELVNALENLAHKRPGVINVLESLTVIVLSAVLVLEPTAHHAHVHTFLLAVELIMVIVFAWVDVLFDRYAAGKREKSAKTAEKTETENEKAEV